MKSCANRGCQKEDAANRCKECGTEFAPPEEVDPQLSDRAEALVVVATFGDSVEDSLLKDRLELAGIEACIPEELNPSPFGNFRPLAHVTVQVHAKDYEAAKEIIAAEG